MSGSGLVSANPGTALNVGTQTMVIDGGQFPNVGTNENPQQSVSAMAHVLGRVSEYSDAARTLGQNVALQAIGVPTLASVTPIANLIGMVPATLLQMAVTKNPQMALVGLAIQMARSSKKDHPDLPNLQEYEEKALHGPGAFEYLLSALSRGIETAVKHADTSEVYIEPSYVSPAGQRDTKQIELGAPQPKAPEPEAARKVDDGQQIELGAAQSIVQPVQATEQKAASGPEPKEQPQAEPGPEQKEQKSEQPKAEPGPEPEATQKVNAAQPVTQPVKAAEQKAAGPGLREALIASAAVTGLGVGLAADTSTPVSRPNKSKVDSRAESDNKKKGDDHSRSKKKKDDQDDTGVRGRVTQIVNCQAGPGTRQPQRAQRKSQASQDADRYEGITQIVNCGGFEQTLKALHDAEHPRRDGGSNSNEKMAEPNSHPALHLGSRATDFIVGDVVIVDVSAEDIACDDTSLAPKEDQHVLLTAAITNVDVIGNETVVYKMNAKSVEFQNFNKADGSACDNKQLSAKYLPVKEWNNIPIVYWLMTSGGSPASLIMTDKYKTVKDLVDGLEHDDRRAKVFLSVYDVAAVKWASIVSRSRFQSAEVKSRKRKREQRPVKEYQRRADKTSRFAR